MCVVIAANQSDAERTVRIAPRGDGGECIGVASRARVQEVPEHHEGGCGGQMQHAGEPSEVAGRGAAGYGNERCAERRGLSPVQIGNNDRVALREPEGAIGQ